MPCIILVTFLSSLGILHIEAAPTYVHSTCSTTGNFTKNSLYQSNLNLLLSSLSSNATTHFFYNTTVAAATSDAVYGLFLCRGDIDDASVCQACVAAAAEEVPKKCPRQKEAIIWNEECMLRYANRSFFGVMDEYPNDYFVENSNPVSDSDRFNEIVAKTVKEAATAAAAAGGPGEKKFAAKEANFSEFRTVYSLVECTPDLSSMDCRRCLDTAIAELPNCCSGEDRVTYLYPSCYLSYDKSRFYNQIVAPTPSPPQIIPQEKSKSSTLKIVAIVVPTAAIAVLFLILGCYCFAIRRAKNKYKFMNEDNAVDIITIESLQCDFATIEAATNNFSLNNKLGQGGFGDVYKGILSNGQEIAVKRLLRSSAEKGVDEFKNEVVLLAKLQHKNLVRLLGFCLAGEEKLLVYEFVPNKSLDYFIYDPRKQGDLNWSTRHKIIVGIAKGILYLHEDSRLKIIHRDLKPGNILLDADYEPKISDFGLARLFEVDQTRADTSRVAGTLGYMSPEYALHGRLSLKSDVYSFGVIILEIISGERNTNFHQSHHDAEDFLSYAWKLWKDGTPWKLLDQKLIASSYSEIEVARCVHIGLLCVQGDPEVRPKTATIVLMLNNSSIPLSPPQRPAYYSRTDIDKSESELMLDESTSREIPLVFVGTN
ncbi:cysteine-rich receptor-like protein kinase 10 [Morus notabilis]|uniref:cysteine-rich receptor-like protein kinase 10 n=1 Tax=Morus notabilis TaxID=981085 RepID=UPI000CED0C8E|nr:cysteine-rich receptor-like protein kinase 10 [Morus notabilis]